MSFNRGSTSCIPLQPLINPVHCRLPAAGVCPQCFPLALNRKRIKHGLAICRECDVDTHMALMYSSYSYWKSYDMRRPIWQIFGGHSGQTAEITINTLTNTLLLNLCLQLYKSPRKNTLYRSTIWIYTKKNKNQNKNLTTTLRLKPLIILPVSLF